LNPTKGEMRGIDLESTVDPHQGTDGGPHEDVAGESRGLGVVVADELVWIVTGSNLDDRAAFGQSEGVLEICAGRAPRTDGSRSLGRYENIGRPSGGLRAANRRWREVRPRRCGRRLGCRETRWQWRPPYTPSLTRCRSGAHTPTLVRPRGLEGAVRRAAWGARSGRLPR